MKRGLVLALGLVTVVIAAGPATALLPRGTVRFVNVPEVTLPIAATELPGVLERPPAHSVGVPMLALPEPDHGGGPPAEIDPLLLERTAAGGLPRIDAHGRTSLQHYARPATADCRRPCVAVLVTGLGLADRLTARALTLPGPVGLSFSPYAGAVAWQARARAAGHEALLMLPLQPERFPHDDAGPLSVRIAADPEGIAAAATRVLTSGSGYVALDGAAGAFARAPAAFAPVAVLLAQRGLGLIEIGGEALAGPARDAGLPYLGAAAPVDQDPSPASIDRALAAVAATALAGGRAVAVARPLPATFDRIAAWIATLPGQGIELVPPSLLLRAADGAAVATRH